MHASKTKEEHNAPGLDSQLSRFHESSRETLSSTRCHPAEQKQSVDGERESDLLLLDISDESVDACRRQQFRFDDQQGGRDWRYQEFFVCYMLYFM